VRQVLPVGLFKGKIGLDGNYLEFVGQFIW
jgi:hypothetical protein